MRRLGALIRSAAAAAIVAAASPLCGAELQAISSDGRWIVRADNESRTLAAIDARSGALVKRIAVADRRGRSSRVARVLDAPPRRSFVVLLADLPETWELTYDPDAAPVFDGLVHDYRMGEGLASRGPLPVRRVMLDVPLADGLFSPDHAFFIGRAGAGELHVVNLDVRRVIERLEVAGEPRPEQGLAWIEADGLHFAFPDHAAPHVHWIAAAGWRWQRSIGLPELAVRIGRLPGGGIGAEFASGETQALSAPN